MPLIISAPPVKGRREPMCKTDEATVRRIRNPGSRYDGMVERIQKVEEKEFAKSQHFITHSLYRGSFRSEYWYEDKCLPYHICKFLALRTAKELFPENFVQANEMMVFSRSGRLYTATYSDFVSDDNGVIERRAMAMKRYYAEPDEGKQKDHKAASDRTEYGVNPSLEDISRRVQKAGLLMNHPEANYHVSNERTVFFEIDGLLLMAILNELTDNLTKDAKAIRALEAVSAIHAMAIKIVSNRLGPDRCGLYPNDPTEILLSAREAHIKTMSLDSIYHAIASVLAAPIGIADGSMKKAMIMLPVLWIRDGAWGYHDSCPEQVSGKPPASMIRPAPLSDIIDPSVIEMLEQERG